MTNTNSQNIKPFLRWAGGKSWIVKYLKDIIGTPKFVNYHEPFLGGASIFLFLKSNNIISNGSYLSDQNKDLINTYKVVQQNPNELITRLNYYQNTKDSYYKERNRFYNDPIEKAAQFIFLNRTSFNGIYRVNQQGVYNVPYGFKSYSTLFNFENIRNINGLLNDVILSTCDFEATLDNIKSNDLVFLDPPYTVAHGKNGFIKYNQKLFAWDDQIRLKKYIENIRTKNAYYILTNAEHISIEDLFSGIGTKYTLPRASVIGGKLAKRNTIQELVFTNL